MTEIGCSIITVPPEEKAAFERALKRWPKDKSLGTATGAAAEGQECTVELNPEFLIIFREEIAKEVK